MGALTNYAENKCLDVFGHTAFAVSAVYIKLHIGDPGEDAANNAAGETTRKVVTFAASSGGSMSSNADATWTSYSTTETISYVSLWDNVSAGNPLWYGPLSPSKAVNQGDTFTIESGSLTIDLVTGALANYAEDLLMNAFRNVSADITACYVKLHISDPGEDATNGAASNTTRQQVTAWNAAASGAKTSNAAVTWTSVSATETYSHISLWDASTSGNALWYGALTTAKSVNAGDTFTISSGSLSIGLD